MPKKRVLPPPSLAPAARQDVRDVLRWSEQKFGEKAAARYRELPSRGIGWPGKIPCARGRRVDADEVSYDRRTGDYTDTLQSVYFAIINTIALTRPGDFVSQNMLAVYLDSNQVSLQQTPPPVRPPGFAQLRLSLAGICNTDLELLRGYYRFSGIPGHEFVATVAASDNPALLHQRVAGEINLACGNCDFCGAGLARHCRHRSVLGIVRHPGAFAEYLTLPQANLHILPAEVSDREAVFIEPLAAACEILDQIAFNSSDEVAVLGDGKLGLLITKVLLAHGLSVTLYGKHESKLGIARADGAVTHMSADLPTARYRYVVECTGSAAGLKSAISMAVPRGTIVMKSTVHEGVSIDTAPVIVNELSLIGSRCGRFEPAIELLRGRKVNVESLISAEFPLSEAPAAFQEADRRGVLKVLLHNDQT